VWHAGVTESPARVSARATLQKTEGSGLHEPRRVSLVVSDNAGPCVAELPVRADTVRAVEAGPGQCCSDPAADFGLSRRLGSKQHPQMHLVARGLRGGVVGRERARRLVLPAPAECDRYGCSESSHIAARFDPHDRLMDEYLAHAAKYAPRSSPRAGCSATADPEGGRMRLRECVDVLNSCLVRR
jgi:hypothetical protein